LLGLECPCKGVVLVAAISSIDKLEEQKYTVYSNTEMEATATKRVAKALVDCKVTIVVVLCTYMNSNTLPQALIRVRVSGLQMLLRNLLATCFAVLVN